MDPLKSQLLHLGRRLRLVDSWQLAQRTLWWACLAALFFQVAGRLWPIASLWLWTCLPFLVWAVLVAGFALLRPIPPMRIARRVDFTLSLRERLSTALALQSFGEAFPASLVQAQRLDALAAAQAIQPARDFPLTWSRRSWQLAFALIAVVLALAFLPNPMDAILEQRAAVAREAERQAAEVENLRQEIEKAEQLSPEERQELLRKLAELAEALRTNPGDLEQALADLSKVEQALQEQLDSNAPTQQANLEALAAQLQALASLQPDPNQDQIAAAAEALEQLAEQMASMDEAQKQQIAEALAQMASQAAQSGDQALAKSLSALAQAAQAGDAQAASQASQQAGQALSQAQQRLADQAAIQGALSRLQASRQALAQAGSAAVAQAPGQGQTPGQNPGQGQGQGQGQVGSGGGTKANTLPPATRQGKASRPQGNAPGAQVGELPGQIYIPRTGGSGDGEEFFIPGQETGQGETQVTEGQSPLPGGANPALVPYNQFYYSYLNAANQAMQQSYIPAGLQAYVRQYFSQLEP